MSLTYMSKHGLYQLKKNCKKLIVYQILEPFKRIHVYKLFFLSILRHFLNKYFSVKIYKSIYYLSVIGGISGGYYAQQIDSCLNTEFVVIYKNFEI